MSLAGDQLRERRYPRYPVSVPTVGHARQIDGPIQGWVRNLSDGGLMAEFPASLLAGSRLGLVLKTHRGALPVEGRVVWTAPRGTVVRHGVAFSRVKDRDFAKGVFLSEGEWGAGEPTP